MSSAMQWSAGPGLLAAAVLALAGCAVDSASGSPGGDRPVVLTTFTVLADIAENVAGEHLTVQSITKVGAEVHGYEPTPLDIAKAAEADLILDNGLNLESWFEQFVEQIDVPYVVVSDGVAVLDATGDAEAGTPNPHAWMSPANAQLYVDAMVAAFTDLAPDHGAAFAANGAVYQAELQAIQDELTADLAVVPQSERALVTCEGAFAYLARDAGLAERYLWPVNADQQATPQRIAATIEYVDANAVPAVFCESTVSDAAMRQVVEATGAAFGGILYVDSLSGADGPVPTYLDLIRYDADTIVAGLAGSAS